MPPILADETATFANSAAADTEVDVDIAGQNVQRGEVFCITVINPSDVTGLNVSVKGVEDFGGTDHFPELASFTVAAESEKQVLVEGWLLTSGRLTISNDTVLGAADGFDAQIRVREIG